MYPHLDSIVVSLLERKTTVDKGETNVNTKNIICSCHPPDSLKSQELKLTLCSMPGLASLDIDLIELSLASEKNGMIKSEY